MTEPVKKQQEIIDAFEAGDMGDVEFTELALEAGVSLEDIGAALARVTEDQ